MTQRKAFNLYPNIVAGEQTIDLSEVNNPLTEITGTFPAEATYGYVEVYAYPETGDYSEPYPVFYDAGPDASIDIFYPGAAFPSYYSAISYETENFRFTQKSTSEIFNLKNITYDISFGLADSKLTYSATGDFDFVANLFYTGSADWIFVLPKGTDLAVPTLAMPEALSAYDVPALIAPEEYQIFAFDAFSDYDGLKTFIRNSTNSVSDLTRVGQDYISMYLYGNPSSSGGRKKPSAGKDIFRGFAGK